jgi:predicted CXXCH cytochrome family protein
MNRAVFRKIKWLLLLGVVYMPAGIAHDACTYCHTNAQPDSNNAPLLASLPGLCVSCHPARLGTAEHVINVTVTTPPRAALPLLNGEVSCTTCHDPHSQMPSLLRMEKSQLCSACHRN